MLIKEERIVFLLFYIVKLEGLVKKKERIEGTKKIEIIYVFFLSKA
jgi:hypothetical protein